MADNITLDPGAAGDVVATEDIAGAQYQKVKLIDGTAASTTVIAAGGGVEAAAIRVTVANDSTGLLPVSAASLPLPSSASTSALQTTGNSSLSAIDTNTTDVPNVVGTDGAVGPAKAVSIAGTESGTGNLQEIRVDADGHLQVDALSSVLPADAATETTLATLAGAVSGTEMQVDIVADGAGLATAANQLPDGHNVTIDNAGGGAAVNIQDGGNTIAVSAASLPLPADASTATLQTAGNASLAVIQSATANEGTALGSGILLQGDDGTDRKNVAVDATTGDLQVDVTNTVTVDGSGVTQPVSGTVTSNAGTGTFTVDGSGVTQPVSGTVTANAGTGTFTVDGSGVTQPVSGTVTANAGTGTMAVSAVSLPLPSNAATSALQTTGNTSLGTIAGAVTGTEMQVDVVAALPEGTNAIGKLAANSGVDIGDVDVLTLPGVAGAADQDAAVSGNPVTIGVEARTDVGTAVGSGDVVRPIADAFGKQVVLPYCLPAEGWSYASPAAVTDTADDQVLAATASQIHYITGVQVFNGHDTVGTEVVIKVNGTVKWRGWAEQTGGGCSASFNPPLHGSANQDIDVANVITGSSTYFNLQGYTATI